MEILFEIPNNSDYLYPKIETKSNGFHIEDNYLTSLKILENSRKINIFSTVVLIIFGLMGHSLTIFVFAQKRFRRNSSNVYFLCLAINDSLYLIIHFFKDTIRSYKNIYFEDSSNSFLNLIDQFSFTCKSLNYLRNVLRFISAYIVISFTIQRLFLVYSPLSNKFKSKKSAWNTVITITLVSLIINLWVPFIFEIQQVAKTTYCDVREGWSKLYFHITLVYICIIILIPILIIFTSNSIIIQSLYRSTQPKKLGIQVNKSIQVSKNKIESFKNSKRDSFILKKNSNKSSKFKPYYLSMNQIIHRVTDKANNSKKLTKMLVLISFSYALLNLPYLITWCCYYYKEQFSKSHDIVQHNYVYAFVKISELFFVLNYSIYFYINLASGSVFRNQLRYSSNIFIS